MPQQTWVLGIDVGTSFSVAAARVDGRVPEVIEVGGQRRVPSTIVVAQDGSIVVGAAAENLAAARPDHALRGPKTRVGDPGPVVLGGTLHDPLDLIAALVRHMYDEAVRERGSEPSAVRLTHPAAWGRPRRDRLVDAARRAGIDEPQLVAEPVAAAVAYADEAGVPSGDHVVVYDLGGGTFDTAVLRATADGFDVIGRPGGEDRLGGDLFDELLVNHIGAQLDAQTWESLQLSDELTWQQAAAELSAQARQAKEALSNHGYAELLVGLPTGRLHRNVTRAEFEALIEPYVAQSVELTIQTVDDAGIDLASLGAVYLAGGASRIPLVEELLTEAFDGVRIARLGDPKTAVAVGATHPQAVRAPITGTQQRNGGEPTTPESAPTEVGFETGDSQSPQHAAPSRPRFGFVAVGAVAVVLLLVVGALIVRSGSKGDTGAVGPQTSAAETTSTERSGTDATTTTRGKALTLVSPPETFLGVATQRSWRVSEDANTVEVSLRLTNTAAARLIWSHDEMVPASLAAKAADLAVANGGVALGDGRTLRWSLDLEPSASFETTYTAARATGWPAPFEQADLARWEAERVALTTVRQSEILASNALTDRVAPAPQALSALVSTTTTLSPTTTVGVVPPPTAPTATAPPPTSPIAPTVSVSGSAQICAGQRTFYTGNATNAVNGTWSIPGFTLQNPSWSPGSTTQFVEPNASAVGSSFTISLTVVSAASISAGATFRFSVVDCTPAPTVAVSGPSTVCAGQTSMFTGSASDATVGSWSLPGFSLNDASWSPGAPSQFVNPNGSAIGSTFTWTLSVTGATGKPGQGSRSFSVVAC